MRLQPRASFGRPRAFFSQKRRTSKKSLTGKVALLWFPAPRFASSFDGVTRGGPNGARTILVSRVYARTRKPPDQKEEFGDGQQGNGTLCADFPA